LSHFSDIHHRVIHPAKQFGDKLFSGHGVAPSRISALQEWPITVTFATPPNRTIG